MKTGKSEAGAKAGVSASCLAPSSKERPRLNRADVKKLLGECRDYIRSGQVTREIERDPERLKERMQQRKRLHQEMTDAIEMLDYEQKRVIVDRMINRRKWVHVYMNLYVSERTAQNRLNAGLDRIAELLSGSETERFYLSQRRSQTAQQE